jgi:hypothetical protein
VPPAQCPACGRFLKRALVDGLADAPVPCPKCGLELTSAMFPGPMSAVPTIDTPGVASPAAPAAADGGQTPVVTAAARPTPSSAGTRDTSVRPPDLPPDDVRDEPDPLAGWDAGVPVGTDAIRDERPFPVDTVAVAGAAVVGAALGVVLGRRRLRDATFGALGGAVGAGVGRRIWQLP